MTTASGSLAERVAEAAGVEIGDVLDVLAAHGVPAASVPAAPRSLRVARLRIAGTKVGVPGAGPFNREFVLPDGVVMAVAPNLRGKTTLLELIALCLRGESAGLQQDVAAWLDEVDCDVLLNGRALAFRLRLADRRIASATIHQAQTLNDLPGAVDGRAVVEAASASEYITKIDTFMLDRLGLEPLHAAVKDGTLQRHGWPSYFSAIYPPAGRDRPLIGETAMAGLAGRLLSVFLDLPRAAVLTRVQAARDRLRVQATTGAARAREAAARSESLRAQQQEALKEATRALAALPTTDTPSATDAAARIAELARRLAEAQADVRALGEARAQARAGRQADERAFNNLAETTAAARLFHGLDPSSCPRCEAPVGAQQRARETAENRCAVCTSPLADEDGDEVDQAVAERSAALEASRRAEAEARDALEAAEVDVARLLSDLRETEAELAAARVARETTERARLETAIARAEGALAVLTLPTGGPSDSPSADETANILTALAAVLEAELKAESAGMFDALGTEIAYLARAFGIEAVSSVRINRAAQLKIEKGGASGGTFSGQSPGERLRLRVATVVALLRVGTRLSIGTHPGLLMIDSLRAEEVQDPDAHALLDALVAVASETPGLQVLTTSQDQSLPIGRLPSTHVLRPDPGTDALW